MEATAAQHGPLTVFQVEVAGSLGGPQPHGVDDVVPVARHRGVVRKSQHHLDPGRTVTHHMADAV